MWNAIRSDFKEFASSIATDGNTVLENIDTKLKETDTIGASTGQTTDDDHEEGQDTGALSMHNEERIRGALLAVDPEIAPTAISPDAEGKGGVDDALHQAMLADAQAEAYRRMEMEITFLTPLLNSEVNGIKETTSTSNVSKVEEQVRDETSTTTPSSEPTPEGQPPLVEEEEALSPNDGNNNASGQAAAADVVDEKGDDHDYEEEEDDDDDDEEVKEYLASFDIQSKTDEISKLLSEQPFLSQQFESLVPVQVTYEQFWQRYFYRCDPVRIVQEWEEEDERMRLQRQELIGKGVKSVQNIFGGAIKAIKGVTATGQDGDTAGTSIYEKYQAELEAKQKAMLQPKSSKEEKNSNVSSGLLGGALGMFSGNNGRPPFVLNTAESDNDEDVDESQYEEGEDEEDGEDELSWGSDDDDNDEEDEEDEELYEDGDDSNLNESELIVFEDKNSTSEDVIKEIENLKSMLEKAQGGKYDAEIKAQALQSELDKVNEAIQQERLDHARLLQEEISKVRNEERARSSALEISKSEDGDDLAIKRITDQLDETQSCRDKAEAQVRELELQISQMNEKMNIQSEKYQKTLEEKKKLEERYVDEINSSEAVINDLKDQLLQSKAMEEETKCMMEKLKKELELCREEMKKQTLNFAKTLEDELAKAKSEGKVPEPEMSPSAQEGSSLSSAVEVLPVNEAAHKPEDEDEDGWGDSWSDDPED